MINDLNHISEQSEWSVVENLKRAINDIDAIFGNGYAKDHPELLGQIVLAASIDYGATIIYDQLGDLSDSVARLESDFGD